MTKTSILVPGLAAASLLTAACSGQPAAAGGSAGTRPAAAATAQAASSGLSSVLLLGDSIAAGEALPLTAAFTASNVHFQSIAADGGGNVVGPFSQMNWANLPGQIAAARPSVVIYQITTYDWGSLQQQEAAYRRLLTTAAADGAKLVFVTAPPIRPDDFYKPHMADLDRTPDAARAVAAGSPGRASVLDAGAVWGSAYQQYRDGKPDRSADGIHTCPQGAARFTYWLLGSLARLFPGFTPANPRAWANTGWSASKQFIGC